MNRRLFVLVIAVLTTLGTLGLGRPHTASASADYISASSNCSSATASGHLTYDIGGAVTIRDQSGMSYDAPVDNGPFSVYIPFGRTYPLGTSLHAELWDHNEHVVAAVTIACGMGSASSSSASVWFTPGDDRVDGRPGDRIAVYCNATATPPNIDVYGVTADGWGHELARFNLADLVKAGQTGITLTSQGLGPVFVRFDGSNQFSAVWSGGQAGARNPDDYAKDFACGVPSSSGTDHGPFQPVGISH